MKLYFLRTQSISRTANVDSFDEIEALSVFGLFLSMPVQYMLQLDTLPFNRNVPFLEDTLILHQNTPFRMGY